MIEHIRIGLTDRMADHLVANHPAIHVEILQVCLGTGERGQPHPAVQTDTIALHIHRDRLLHEALATQLGHPRRAQGVIQPGGQLVDHLLVVGQTESGVELTERDTPEHFFQVVEFGFFGAQETAPGRGVEEQVAHGHGGAARVSRRA